MGPTEADQMEKRLSDDREHLARLWDEHIKNPTPQLTSILTESYRELVLKAVGPYRLKKPRSLDLDDLIQAGMIGLLQAIERYDPDRGVPFRTYAARRINGSILDEINKANWTPRSVRENIKSVMKSIEVLYTESSDKPTVDQIAAKAGIDVESTRLVLMQMDKTFIQSAEQETLDLVGPSSDPEKSDLRSSINIVMETKLTEVERQIIEMKHFGGYNNMEIMSALKLTQMEFRLLKDQATEKLIEALDGYLPH